MQAVQAYCAGMQYTIRNVPEGLDKALRDRAARERRSINDVAIDALSQAFGLSADPVRYRDLGEFAGTWVEDPEIDRTLEDQRRIDPDLWR